jgi:hypothetical protein
MKSQVNALLHVVRGLSKDIIASYPALEGSISKDLERIALYCQTRGLGFFTLDLPHLGSLLISGLESGSLRLEGPLSHAVSKGTKVPRLFSGLWLLVFDKCACLKREVDVNALFFLRELCAIGKKIEVDCSVDRTQLILEKYHDVERKLRTPTLRWECDDLLDYPSRSSSTEGLSAGDRDPFGCDHSDRDLLSDPSFDEERKLNAIFREVNYTYPKVLSNLHIVQAIDHAYPNHFRPNDLFREEGSRESSEARTAEIRVLNRIQKVADLIFGSFDSFDSVSLSGEHEEDDRGTGFKHGPGAVAERLKNWEKSQFPNWPHKLENVFPFRYCGTYATSGLERPSYNESASRLLAVPKTAKGPRLIAAEPTSHQWCQQLVLRFLFDQCRKHFGESFIDFKDQSKSGDLVLQASLDRRLATVDLSDASDRLSCWTVERLLRRNPSLLVALHAARTRHIKDEISDIPSFLSLRKFASQGTATTFPVMSLVMLCIALGSTLTDDNVTWATLRKYRNQVRIFGDDIILPGYGYERLVRSMELLQLKVNTDKSFIRGHFRESCGVDGFMGYDITPTSPKTLVADSPASCQAVVDYTNNLFNKGLWHASDACRDLLPVRVQRGLRVVGPHGVGFSGFSSFSGSDERHLVKRWNSRLHRNEVRVWSKVGRTQKRHRDDVSVLLEFFSRSYNPRNPRVVSEYGDVRKANTRFLWEPQNTDARTYD